MPDSETQSRVQPSSRRLRRPGTASESPCKAKPVRHLCSSPSPTLSPMASRVVRKSLASEFDLCPFAGLLSVS